MFWKNKQMKTQQTDLPYYTFFYRKEAKERSFHFWIGWRLSFFGRFLLIELRQTLKKQISFLLCSYIAVFKALVYELISQ